MGAPASDHLARLAAHKSPSLAARGSAEHRKLCGGTAGCLDSQYCTTGRPAIRVCHRRNTTTALPYEARARRGPLSASACNFLQMSCTAIFRVRSCPSGKTPPRTSAPQNTIDTRPGIELIRQSNGPPLCCKSDSHRLSGEPCFRVVQNAER